MGPLVDSCLFICPDMAGIKDLDSQDRPREKLVRKGQSVLTDTELLAILLGSGTRDLSAIELAQMILSKAKTLDELAKWSVPDLMKFQGVGEAKAVTIVSALELGRRRGSQARDRAEIIRSSADAFEWIKPDLADLNHEEFWMILLKRNGAIIRKIPLSSGGAHGTVVDPKSVFKQALDLRASSMIVARNHPSGNLEPSAQDRQLTRKLVEAGRLLEIQVLDHLIVTQAGYYSFADNNGMG